MPAALHTFANKLPEWQRNVLILALCVIVAHVWFKLFSPRISHLCHFVSRPPIWAAWLLGLVVVAAIDVQEGLSPKTYKASSREWLGYAGGSLALICIYKAVLFSRDEPQDDRWPAGTLKLFPGAKPTWEQLEEWLKSDSPACFDLLDNKPVADRLVGLLANGARSIGIVGPFGIGKTSVVKWVVEGLAKDDSADKTKVLVSEHSCWGFTDSASSIHTLLAGAVAKVGEQIDTFDVNSLPESYRETFSAGGKWFENISNIVIAKRDPMDQFRSLSGLLTAMDASLVIVVEDLDRNESKNFNIQEVLGFLQQLKEFENFAFILTGGLRSPARIDFAKLCDHIEYLKEVEPNQSGAIVELLRNHCLDPSVFAHEVLTDAEHNTWKPNSWILLSHHDEIWPPQAIAALLSTPRALRHALGRTYLAWQSLYGEVDWDHLLAINTLRWAAPEAFSFVLRHWNRLHKHPATLRIDRDQQAQIQKALERDWDEVTQGADWDRRAARTLIEFILPDAPLWFGKPTSTTSSAVQGLQTEPYWTRAISEVVAPSDVRDQVVLKDLKEWCESPSSESRLVVGTCRSEAYNDVLKRLAHRHLGSDADRLLLLSQQVLSKIAQLHGSAASSDSPGFVSTFWLATRWATPSESKRAWLEDRISDAMSHSLMLVNCLYHFWGSTKVAFLVRGDLDKVRKTVLRLAKKRLTSSDELCNLIHPQFRSVLYGLVFEPDGGEQESIHRDVESWKWLGPVLLDSLRAGSTTIALEVCVLIAARDESHSRRYPARVDLLALMGFFGKDTEEAVEMLGRLADQVDPSEQAFVREIVTSAKSELAKSDQ